MKKSTTSFVCQECGYDTPGFLGKCPECGSWNSLREFKTQSSKIQTQNNLSRSKTAEVKKISEVLFENKYRVKTGFSEMDLVLSGEGVEGGFVKGSVTLLAGDPGIGKSTLLLQIAMNISDSYSRGPATPPKVLYISGEESEEQIKMRAERLSKEKNDNLFVLSINDTDQAISAIDNTKPDFVIVDSIQTFESENVSGLSGSIPQVRFAAMQFIRIAKSLKIPTVLVGHVTKEGMVAGPMVLSHMVDTVLFLEGEKVTSTRILRSLKNRFGPVDEVGIFKMDEGGMEDTISPEQIFLSKISEKTPGSVITATLEGRRAFLVELQALAVFSKFPMPRRVVSGIDPRRVELLLAILQKHARMPVETMDIFVNVAGGMRISDPCLDLGICLAIVSSIKNIDLSKIVALSEVGLLGELRIVEGLEKRIKEAKKLGFKTIISAKEYKTLSQAVQAFVK